MIIVILIYKNLGDITMNKNILKKFSCGFLVIAIAVCTTACFEDNTVPPEGYKVPYTYADGHETTLKTVEDSRYVNTSTDLVGNQVFHLTTSQSEEYVKNFYDEYFSTLQEVIRTDDKDDTKGYYDSEKRLIMYNLVVWTADGATNYKLQSEACDNITDSKNWKLP